MTAVPHPLTQAPPSSLVQCCKLPLQLLQLVFHTFLKPNLVSMALTMAMAMHVFLHYWSLCICVVLVVYCDNLYCLGWLLQIVLVGYCKKKADFLLAALLHPLLLLARPPCCCCFVSTSFHLSANSPPPQPQHIDMLHTLNHFNTPKTFLTPCCCSARRSLSPH